MSDDRHQITNAELDQILRAIGQRLDIPPMRDAAGPARLEIEARARTLPRHAWPGRGSLPPEPEPEAASSEVSSPSLPAGQPGAPIPFEPERSRWREVGLLAAGLASAAVLVVALVAVFGGLNLEDDERRLASAPMLGAAYRIPGFEFVGAFGAPKIPNEPLDVAVGEDGTRYVVDAGLNRVVAFTPDGEIDEDWGEDGLSPPITDPVRIALAQDGSLYVLSRQVNRLSPDGTTLEAWPLPSASDGIVREDIEACGSGVATDSAGNVYALCGTSSGFVRWEVLLRWDSDGELEEAIRIGALEASSLAIDSQDRVYLGTERGEIHTVRPFGTDAGTVELPLVAAVGLDRIDSLAIGPDDTLIAMQLTNSSGETPLIARLDANGVELDRWEVDAGHAFAISSSPGTLRVSAGRDGDIIVPDPAGRRILVFGLEGDLRAEIADDTPQSFGRLWRVEAAGDSLYGLDPSVESRILELSPDGDLRREIDLARSPVQAVSNPLFSPSFAVASNGSVVYADPTRSRVAVYSANGTLEDDWGPIDLDTLAFPRAMTSDREGFIYVADETGASPKKFTLDGDLVAALGDASAERYDLAYHDGAVWMTDGGQISRYPVDGGASQVITTATMDADEPGLHGLLLSLDLDAEGNIYVYSLLIDRSEPRPVSAYLLTKLDSRGRVLWSEKLAENRDRYIDIAIGPDGTLYLADSELHQILAYRPVDDAPAS